MRQERSTEGLDGVREHYERQNQRDPYIPRPKWQIVMAWVLFAIVVLGVVNICWLQITGQ